MMSPGRHVSSECSYKLTYKCCKTKQFLHYVCIKCHGIYHKSCLPKYKSKIRFIKDNQIACCDNDSIVSDLDDEKEMLEKTINELAEDGEMKNKHIQKIKSDYEAFVQEALKREDEMCELIKQQEKNIKELNEYIKSLKKNTQTQAKDNIKKNTVFTQSQFIINKNAATNTECIEKTVTEKITEEIQINTPTNSEPKEGEITVHDSLQGGNKITTNSDDNRNIDNPNKDIKNKKKILLTDEIDVLWKMRKLLDLSLYEIVSLKKPGAYLNQVMEDIENLTSNFNFDDYVVIIGGSNDIDKKKTPSFRVICNKLKLVAHTNILFVSIPYVYNDTYKNKHIYKFNAKLSEFLHKFNNYTEGHIEYVEINSKSVTKLNCRLVASIISKAIMSKKYSTSNLRFISVCDMNNKLPSLPTQIQNSDHVPNSVIVNEEQNSGTSSFLYPRLSQVILLD